MTGSHSEISTVPDAQLASDLALLTATIYEAGDIALKYFKNNPNTQIKADGTEVSEADLAVNDHIHQRLTTSRPAYGWLSEETEQAPDRLDAACVWIVDPIDGTRGFIKESTDWTIAVSLVKNGAPIVGAVFAPAREVFYAAAAGQGATRNGSPITVADQSNLAGARIISGKNLLKSDAWQQPWPDIELTWANSMAYRLCLVADGTANATISLTPKSDWDVAGADVILREAGGQILNDDGKTPTYNKQDLLHNGIIAAGPALLKEIMTRARAKKS